MRNQVCATGFGLGVIVGLIVGAVCSAMLGGTLAYQRAAPSQQPAGASSRLQDFLRTRTSAYRALQERASSLPAGVTLVSPRTERGPLESLSFPPDSHIEGVVRSSTWTSNGSFQLLLNLEDAAIPPGKQGNSETMAASALLEHFFGGLTGVGFHGNGSGGAGGGGVQSANGRWFLDDERNIEIDGVVFVAPESKRAIVVGITRERFEEQ
jgi:hypothetical protein